MKIQNLLNQKKAIGILGGMGPDASARLYQLMVEMAREEFGARRNEEYPEIVLDSVPVPDFIADSHRAEEALFILKDRVKKLSQLPLSCFALACNTAHIVLVDLQTETDIPFVSLPKETVMEIVRRRYKKVGLLASPMTIACGVYQNQLNHQGVVMVLPTAEQVEILGMCIREIVSGIFKPAKKQLLRIADSFRKQKVEALILGCTELPLVFPKNYSLPVIDSLEILARTLLKIYYQKDPPSSRCDIGTTARQREVL